LSLFILAWLLNPLYAFLSKAEPQVDSVLKEVSKMETDYKKLLEFYGEDDGVQPEEFFAIPVKFSSDLKRAISENKVAAESAKPKVCVFEFPFPSFLSFF